ncbi:23S rRNA (uracil(1939)-C(5))-methyltransferase RlmD [Alkalicoccus urumqiensis]|uniref:23S rRNA (Uracil(1939)-C(5))-methyltransferase RlmD n=1 Tax=Alkalicoccus urumqiensis TaxID=1548213 RepID=A0A2P6MGM8_ALKUR|nr:23S rRNA (uracil(1939)-C(5))-methyltransferase RlmD [Alkalicoccus urumqiensis]PRO65439.1 23S rRNA (uracil(1939)-C(5))-methyltransferase RlmD [Alkalicoccus urumqiensis]
MGQKMEKGSTFPLTVKRMGIDGEGVGFFKRKVVFVPGALPGEEVVCRAQKVSDKFITASLIKVRKSSSERITPPCPVYDRCGGCQLQHLSYEGQLKEKRDIVVQAFERYAKKHLSRIDIRPALGMKDPWRYRNKSQMQAGVKNGHVIAGLYQQGSHKLLDIDTCIVQHPVTEEVTNKIKQIAEDLSIPIYNPKKHQGALRTIVVRTGFETGETQLVLVTATDELPKREIFVEEIQKRIPELVSIVHNVQPKKSPIVFGDKTTVLAGKEKITETLDGTAFDLSARAFFQLNPEQTKVLYDEAVKAAALTGKENVVDAYCGTGTIGIRAAANAREVRGMDITREAVEDANENAAANQLSHARFYHGPAEKLLPEWMKEGWKPDVIIVDPPRTGLDASLLKLLLTAKVDRFVYVSCNPSTLAKNADELIRGGYTLDYAQPVDMFPQTAQTEVTASFRYTGK